MSSNTDTLSPEHESSGHADAADRIRGSYFVTTQWGLVAQAGGAGPGSTAALEAFCSRP